MKKKPITQKKILNALVLNLLKDRALKSLNKFRTSALINHITLLFLLIFPFSATSNINLTVSNATQAKMPLAILIDTSSSTAKNIADTLKKDLMFTDQFNVKVKNINNAPSKKELAHLVQTFANQAIPLALYFSIEQDNTITWRLYDTFQGTMIQGKKYKPHGTIVRAWAHKAADEIYKALTGHDGFFSSRITYCKELKTDGHVITKHIYIADYDGSNTELIVDTPTINVAPRWNNNQASSAALFYSEYTDTNVQLKRVAINEDKNEEISSNLDGVSMHVSFSPNGEQSIFCASRGKGSCQIMYQTKNTLRNITNNKGNNDSPLFIDDNLVCFCSDFQTKSPQIYIGNLQTGHIQRITKGGYCTSPSYCPKNNSIAYHMKVNNVMQIYVYDCTTKTHTQITYGPENKHSASWSPDGTHLMFTKEGSNKNQIVALNLSTKKLHHLTSVQDNCSYPHWSGIYKTFPSIRNKTNRQFFSIC